ncbi:P-loop containing nucleoside triphosphate hydrolase protein [Lipomyces oligophaga]|uniref:P-loop containing nucleoside triphosphate hydrolase protein n=1 Tax=Lipomyces oligophaga TaxID=45792 RepID=UPI0034CFF539
MEHSNSSGKTNVFEPPLAVEDSDEDYFEDFSDDPASLTEIPIDLHSELLDQNNVPKSLTYEDLVEYEAQTSLANGPAISFIGSKTDDEGNSILQYTVHSRGDLEYSASLNVDQASAVIRPVRSCVIALAGPGTGKTKTLVSRILHLLSCQVKPENIVATTFTRKAADELRDRVAAAVGEVVARKLILGTFHSIAHTYLRRNYSLLDISPRFQIATEDDVRHFINLIIAESSVNRSKDSGKAKQLAQDLRKSITSIKSKGIDLAIADPNDIILDSPHLRQNDSNLVSLCFKYQQILQNSHMLDYDDILIRCEELFKKYPSITQNIEAVLVDEFQDTNKTQYSLMKHFVQHSQSLFVVGDPDQSIYGFRAAELASMDQLQSDFPSIVRIDLRENYRSSEPIVSTATSIISQDKQRIEREVMTRHNYGAKPVCLRFESAEAEAGFIVSEIKRLMSLSCGVLTSRDFAVFARISSIMKPLETALTFGGINHRVVGGMKFTDREEIKILIAYLSVIDSRTSPALGYILNTPRRGIGDATQQKMQVYARKRNLSLWDAIVDILEDRWQGEGEKAVSTKTKESIRDFVRIIETGSAIIEDTSRGPKALVDVIDYIIEELQYKQFIKNKHEVTYDMRISNVEQLVARMQVFADTWSANENLFPGIAQSDEEIGDTILTEFLAALNLSWAAEEALVGDSPDLATLSTIHAAKGLEYPIVFVAGAAQGIIPHHRSLETEKLISEERRLFYVAVTRAKSLLYITYPKRLDRWLSDKIMQSGVSVSDPSSMFISHMKIGRSAPRIDYNMMKQVCTMLEREPPTKEAFKQATKECISNWETEEITAHVQKAQDDFEAWDPYTFDGWSWDTNEWNEGRWGNWEGLRSRVSPVEGEVSSEQVRFQSRSDRSRQRTVSSNGSRSGNVVTISALVSRNRPMQTAVDVAGKFAASFISGSKAMEVIPMNQGSKSKSSKQNKRSEQVVLGFHSASALLPSDLIGARNEKAHASGNSGQLKPSKQPGQTGIFQFNNSDSTKRKHQMIDCTQTDIIKVETNSESVLLSQATARVKTVRKRGKKYVSLGSSSP